ncbi:thiol reductant ABC exporter subunit CydC [Virgibacillus kimchii]
MRELKVVTKLMLRERRDILLSIVLGVVAGFAAVGLFSASGYLISKAALQTPLYALIIVISTVKLLGFIRAISRYAERYFSHRATFTILSNIRVSFFERLERVVPGVFQKYQSGDLLSRVVGDVERLQDYFLRVFYPPIVLAIVFLSTILFTIFVSVYTAIVLLIGLLLTGFVFPALFTIKQRKLDNQVRTERGRLSAEVSEFLYGFRDLKIYQKLEEKREQLAGASESYLNGQKKEGKSLQWNETIITMTGFFITWVVVAMGVWLVAAGQLEGVFLAMLVMLSITIFEDTPAMAGVPVYLNETKQAMSRLLSVSEAEDEERTGDLHKLPDDKAVSLEMENVDFTFPGEWRKALDNVTLTIPAGSKTAIVGPSGSGKSTVFQLLLNMYEAEQGKIRWNGMELAAIEQESIWQAANVVLQENQFFYGTVKENLQLGDESATDEEMEKVLADVRLEHFSLDEPVYEKGGNLSGGERQRLAMARAMLKGKRLWLLDEPTSSVDAVTESAIFQQLFASGNEDTVILISHKLTGLEKMDQIIVMEQGRVKESGTYSELMAQKGYFYEMQKLESNLL